MASSTEMVRSYVESLIEQMTGAEKVEPDDDGDYPVTFGDALYFIRIIAGTEPIVHVFSVAVQGVQQSTKLLRAVNAINADLRFCRMFWIDGAVVVAADQPGSTLDPVELDACASAVGSATNYFGPRLVKEFGGELVFKAAADGDGGPVERHTGMYM